MINIEINKEALYRYTWHQTIIWSCVGCIFMGAGLLFLLLAWINRNKMKSWCFETSAIINEDEIIVTRPGLLKTVTHVAGHSIGYITVTTGPIMKKLCISNIELGIGMIGNRITTVVIPAVNSENVEMVVRSIKTILPNKAMPRSSLHEPVE